MHCRSCGADLPADAEYCSRCGARVELGSVLGVGTDLPPVAPREQSAPAPAPAPAEDLSQTRELPRVAPVEAPATQPAQPAQPAAPGQRPAPAAARPVEPEPVRGPGHSRGSIVAMVATFVVLTLVGTFALTRILGSDDPKPTATGTPSSASSSTGEETGASPSAPSSDAPSASAASPSAGATIPAGARRCSTSGSDAVATAYAGTERTSCEFAGAVRDAYRKAGTPDGATTLRAYSPVTKKWYSLSCDGGEPVRCTSTTNAVVLLAP